jgi:hypothetical protein
MVLERTSYLHPLQDIYIQLLRTLTWIAGVTGLGMRHGDIARDTDIGAWTWSPV